MGKIKTKCWGDPLFSDPWFSCDVFLADSPQETSEGVRAHLRDSVVGDRLWPEGLPHRRPATVVRSCRAVMADMGHVRQVMPGCKLWEEALVGCLELPPLLIPTAANSTARVS